MNKKKQEQSTNKKPSVLRQIFSIKRFGKSLSYALAGWRYLLFNEIHFMIHTLTTILVVLLGWFFEISILEWCLLVLVIGMVLVSEALNTSLERLTDLVTEEKHPIAKIAKDTAAAAVLIASMVALIIGGLIFIPKIGLAFGFN